MCAEVPSHTNPAVVERGLRPDYSLDDQTSLEKGIADRRADVRRAVTGIMSGITGLRPGFNWAIYNLQPNPAPGYEPSDDAEREILLIVDTRDPSMLANIRIITNEGFGDEDIQQFYTEDFTLTNGNIVQFFVDTAMVRNDGTLREENIPLFWVEDELLQMPGYADVTSAYGVGETVDFRIRHGERRGETVTIHGHAEPFGVRKSILDQLDALTSAQNILTELTYMEPIYFGSQPRIG
jgi:hypothetical protein